MVGPRSCAPASYSVQARNRARHIFLLKIGVTRRGFGVYPSLSICYQNINLYDVLLTYYIVNINFVQWFDGFYKLNP